MDLERARKINKTISEWSKVFKRYCRDCSRDESRLEHCCEYCNKYNGYLITGKEICYIIIEDLDDLESNIYYEPYLTQKQLNQIKNKYNWDEDTGFLSRDGCRLPREKRSIACNLYACPQLINELSDKYNIDFARLLKGIFKDYYKAKKVLNKQGGV